MRTILITMLALAPLLSYARHADFDRTETTTRSNEGEPRVPGYIDANGLKQGYFIVYGKDRPEVNYPMEGKVEEGNYKDDRKTGEWIAYHPDGKTPRCVGNFIDGRANGPYTKFNEKGIKTEQGTYNNKKQTGELIIYHENGTIAQKKNFNAEGKMEGTQQYFHDNGQLEFEFTSVNGVTTGEARRYWRDGTLKETLIYDGTGGYETYASGNVGPQAEVKEVIGTGGPEGSKGKMLSDKFKPDGYNKVYNDNKELWMDGLFKGGRLWDGELYKYDSDGLLLKIEVWKNGAYHSDGQI